MNDRIKQYRAFDGVIDYHRIDVIAARANVRYEAASFSTWLDLLVGLCWYFEFISTLLGG